MSVHQARHARPRGRFGQRQSRVHRLVVAPEGAEIPRGFSSGVRKAKIGLIEVRQGRQAQQMENALFKFRGKARGVFSVLPWQAFSLPVFPHAELHITRRASRQPVGWLGRPTAARRAAPSQRRYVFH